MFLKCLEILDEQSYIVLLGLQFLVVYNHPATQLVKVKYVPSLESKNTQTAL